MRPRVVGRGSRGHPAPVEMQSNGGAGWWPMAVGRRELPTSCRRGCRGGKGDPAMRLAAASPKKEISGCHYPPCTWAGSLSLFFWLVDTSAACRHWSSNAKGMRECSTWEESSDHADATIMRDHKFDGPSPVNELPSHESASALPTADTP